MAQNKINLKCRNVIALPHSLVMWHFCIFDFSDWKSELEWSWVWAAASALIQCLLRCATHQHTDRLRMKTKHATSQFFFSHRSPYISYTHASHTYSLEALSAGEISCEPSTAASLHVALVDFSFIVQMKCLPELTILVRFAVAMTIRKMFTNSVLNLIFRLNVSCWKLILFKI